MNPILRLEDDRAAALRLVKVSHETIERLDQFAALLIRWQKAVQLIGASTLPKLWTRHIADSLQLLDHAPAARTWVDLGSGGGFPGMVIAIALADRPGALVHLIESDSRKASFLREAGRVTGAPVMIYEERIEAAAKRIAAKIEVVTARAVAPLPRLLALAEPFLAAGACGLFLKGQDVDNELTAATKSWIIQATILPSRTDPGGRILFVKTASPRPKSGTSPETEP